MLRFIQHCRFLLILAALGLVTSCDKNKPKDPADTFDKKALLSQIGGQLAYSAYTKFATATDSLSSLFQEFKTNKTSNNLSALQTQFVRCNVLFQEVSVFELGPAETQLFRANANTFPCDTAQIISKIQSGDFQINTAADIDAKGFPALDFLFFDIHNSDAFVLQRFTTHAQAENYVQYAEVLINELQLKSNTIAQAWAPNGGNYLASFISNTSSSTGGSIGMLVNQLCLDLELLKNASIAIPAGKRSLGVLFPEKTEGYYSKLSLQLAKARLHALQQIYTGTGMNGNGIGFDDYLNHLNAKYGNSTLDEAIRNKFKDAKSALEDIPVTLAESVSTQSAKVDKAYAELQQLVVLLKVDMTSLLGVQITYQDNDGD
jgi:predicted lipoprotein